MTSFYGDYREKGIISDEEENRVSRANVDKWIFRLFLVLIGFMPLIVLASMKEVVSPLVSNVEMLSSGIKGDLFTNCKSLVLLIITVISGLLLLAKLLFMNGTIRKTKLNYFLSTFTIIIVISTILSPNISIALNGQYNRSDGAITWLCYIALLFIALNIEYPKNVIRYVAYSFVPFVVINFIVITMYFYNNDLLQHKLVQSIIMAFLPNGASLGEGSALLGTLNHGNYMSGMFAILTLMYMAGVIVEKSTRLKIINLVLSMLSILVVFMSLSTSGFLTILFISVFLLWLLIKCNKKLITIIMLSVFLIFSGFSLHTLAQKNSKVWEESFGFFTSSNPYVEETVTVSVNQNFTDQLVFGHKVSAANNNFNLPVLPESGVGAGSGRVYIWEKTLNLVMDRPLFGYGLDTLMYNFPHNNIDARANLETENVIVDKPHNMYVGVLYGTGILGLTAFMCIILFTVYFSFNEIFKYKALNGNIAILCIAWLSFLLQAMFNDTLAGVAGPMFIVVGMIVINQNKSIEE